MNRRQFLILTAAAMLTGCQTTGGGSTAVREERVVNAGAVSDYAADGLYARFRDQGFFVIRQSEQLFALSSICTHRTCKLDAEPIARFSVPATDRPLTPEAK